MKRRNQLATASWTLGLLAATHAGVAATITFDNDDGTLQWGDANNWSTGVLPGPADVASFATGVAGGDQIALGVPRTVDAIEFNNAVEVSVGDGGSPGLTLESGDVTRGSASANSQIRANLTLNAHGVWDVVSTTGGELQTFGDILGGQSITKTGEGTWRLAGGSTFDINGLALEDGVTRVSNEAQLGNGSVYLTNADGVGPVSLNFIGGAKTVDNSLVLGSTLDAVGAVAASAPQGEILISLAGENRTFNAMSGRLTLDGTISGDLNGEDLVFVANSPADPNAAVVLTQANTYTNGETRIRSDATNAGTPGDTFGDNLEATLLANNASGSATGSTVVVIEGNAVLGGTGAVTGTTVVGGGGAIAPGDGGIESLATGSVRNFGPGSFRFEVGGSSSADLLEVIGEIDLDADGDLSSDATLELTSLAGAFDGSDYTLFTFTQGTVGSGSNVFTDLSLDGSSVTNPALFNANGFLYGLSYVNAPGGGGSIDLVVIPEPASMLLVCGGGLLLAGRRGGRSR